MGSNCQKWEKMRWASVPVTFSPTEINLHEQVTHLKEQLSRAFSSDPEHLRLLEPAEGSWQIEICMAVYSPTPGNSSSSNTSNLKGFIEVHDKFCTREVLKGLRHIYGDELKLTVLVGNFRDTFQSDNTVPSLQMRLTEEDTVNGCGLEKSELPVTGNISLDEWKQSSDEGRWAACITIFAVVPDNKKIGHSMTDIWSMNKKLLLDQLCTDATIVAKNGVGVNCHKVFLSVHSPVLAAMFQTAMQESQTSTVKMPDMSEASVRTFLDFLYCWETKEADSNSLICFELLSAGHKYHIIQLENRMEEILLVKNNDWYDVDMGVKLFLLSRNLPNGDKLKLKALQVLKTKRTCLNGSSAYQQVFKDDPKAAMDLCENAFAV